MIVRPGTWDEVEPGVFVQAPDGTMWFCREMRQGWRQLIDKTGRRMSIPPQLPGTPATLIVPSTEEAIRLLLDELGGQVITE